MKGLKLMYSYKYKIVGVVVSGLGLAGMVGERLSPFVLHKKLSPEQHYSAFLWIMYFGLFILAYCKEKYDDERAKLVRLKAFQLSFMIMMSTMMAMALTMSLAKPGALEADASLLFLFVGLGIIGYLLYFYTGLYFDQFWDFEDEDRTIWQNIKAIPKNIGGLLVYLLVFTTTLFLLMLI